jgi:hypothetical protein
MYRSRLLFGLKFAIVVPLHLRLSLLNGTSRASVFQTMMAPLLHRRMQTIGDTTDKQAIVRTNRKADE